MEPSHQANFHIGLCCESFNFQPHTRACWTTYNRCREYALEAIMYDDISHCINKIMQLIKKWYLLAIKLFRNFKLLK